MVQAQIGSYKQGAWQGRATRARSYDILTYVRPQVWSAGGGAIFITLKMAFFIDKFSKLSIKNPTTFRFKKNRGNDYKFS